MMRYERWCRRIKAKTCFPSCKALSPCLWQRQNRILLNKNRHYCSIQASLLSSSMAAFPLPLLWWLRGSLLWPLFPTSPQLQGQNICYGMLFSGVLGYFKNTLLASSLKNKNEIPFSCGLSHSCSCISTILCILLSHTNSMSSFTTSINLLFLGLLLCQFQL